jgi:hypothetical protein
MAHKKGGSSGMGDRFLTAGKTWKLKTGFGSVFSVISDI